MPRCLRLLVLTTALLAATPAHANNSEICDRIFQSLERAERAASERAESTASFWNFAWLGGIWSPTGLSEPRARQEPTPPFPEAEYWVTIEPGTARGPDCKQGLVRSIYYLPGLVVQPVLDLGDDGVLLVTEHGLYAILPKRHLQPITADSHYIFSDGVYGHRLCVNSASLNPDCDALLQSADAEPSTARLHAIFSYIHGRSPSDMEERRRLYLRSHHQGRLPDDEEERALLCDRFTAGSLFSRTRTTDPMPTIDHVPGYKAVSMSLCTYNTSEEPPDPLARRGGIKIVTLEGAKESFSVAFQTVYLRRSDQILDLSKLLDGSRLFRSRKECSEDLTISDFQTVGATGGANINALVFDAGVEVELQRRRAFTQNFNDLMFVISVHTAHPDELNSIEQFFRKTYDIWTVYSCEDGSVSQPNKIVLYHELPRDSYIELDPQELRNEYERHHGKRGQPTRSSELALYNDGYIWRYSDYQDYVQWRKQIHQVLEDNPKILDLADHENYRHLFREKPHLFTQLVDHFVHLTLTAAFYSSIDVPGGSGTED